LFEFLQIGALPCDFQGISQQGAYALARLDAQGVLRAVITQNIVPNNLVILPVNLGIITLYIYPTLVGLILTTVIRKIGSPQNLTPNKRPEI